MLNEPADPTIGPLFKVGIVRIKRKLQNTGLVFAGTHAIFDNISLVMLLEDLASVHESRRGMRRNPCIPGQQAYGYKFAERSAMATSASSRMVQGAQFRMENT
ncbi:hypothetical protein VTO42DRAFT_8021 [Malbranchea cinnamomea]